VVILQQSTFFRANAFRDVSSFNVENRTCWDYELLFDFAASGKKFQHVPRYWSAFRMHSSSISGSGRLVQQYYRDYERIVEPATAHYGWMLPAAKAAARLEKHLISPRTALLRLWDRVWGSPEIRL
jgi:hypothetical protein